MCGGKLAWEFSFGVLMAKQVCFQLEYRFYFKYAPLCLPSVIVPISARQRCFHKGVNLKTLARHSFYATRIRS